MKVVIEIPETAYEAFKEWHKNKVATVEQSLIAQGTPYEERPHGEWENCGGIFCARCSVCKEIAYETAGNFCPNCGADMREEGEEE